ncbi:hypothetical protein ZTR_10369 [Talaromyces verruculosus]|nr:hypothetical protein ZTR_10369 [Talaromyces verruculosus]
MGRLFSLIKVLPFQNDDGSVLLTGTAPLGDNDVPHTSETPAHNTPPIEMNSSSAPQPVDTLGREANLPTIDAASDIGSMGGLFDLNFDDDVQGPPQTPQHASPPVPSYYQDRNNDGTLSRDMLSAQNIPSIEAGSNTVVADHHMEQVDPYDHGYSSSSMVGATPDLAQTSDPIEQNFDSCQNSQRLGCFTPPECITEQDSPSYSSLAASPGIGRSPLTVSTSDCNQSSHDTGGSMLAESSLAGTAGAESYPTPVSTPSHTPKPANRVQKRKPRKATREKAIREDRDVLASTLSTLERGNPSPSNEINSPQMGLLRCLVSKACQVTNGETLREVDKLNDGTLRTIYETGDRIVRGTCVILNDWSEWLLREFQPALLPPYHSLSTVEKCVAASRILVEPKDGNHGKSIRRRLAQVLLHIFVPVYAKELEIRENEGETFHRNGRRPMTMAHDFIIGRVGDLNTQDRDRVVNSKNYGKRWWRLGSGIGLITVLTCAPDLVIGDMENRTYTDDFLKLLVNYVRNAYPSAVAHFQLLDPIIQSLFANTSLPTNASVRLDSLHLEFNALPERVQWFNTEKAMEAATDRFLRLFK